MVIQRVGTYSHENRIVCLMMGDHCQDTDDDGYCNKCGDSPIGDDFDDFVAMVAEVTAYFKPQWRDGQSAFNTLAYVRPDLTSVVRGSIHYDPFHRDDLLPAFYEYVETNW